MYCRLVTIVVEQALGLRRASQAANARERAGLRVTNSPILIAPVFSATCKKCHPPPPS